MPALLVGGQILVLLAMVAVSVWGRKHIDDAVRTPVRLGTSGFDWTMSKKTTLIYTPALGLFIVVATLALMDSSDLETFAAIGLALMVFFLLAHWSAVKRAAR